MLFLFSCQNPTPQPPIELNLCQEDNALFDVRLEQSSTTTMWKMEWSEEHDDRIFLSTNESSQRELSGNGTGELLLFGLPPSSTTEVYIERLIEGQRVCSAPQILENDSLPATFPELVQTGEGVLPEGFLATTITTEATRYVVLLNTQGSVVWWYEVPYRAAQVPLSHVEILSDGLVFTENAPNSLANGFVSKIDWMGNIQHEIEVSGLNIGFAVISDGHYFALTSEALEEGVDEDVLVEVQMEEIQEIWRATDQFPLPPSAMLRDSWVHSNYLYFDSDKNELLMSMEFINSVGALNLDRLEFDWLVFGLGGDQTLPLYSSEAVARPHSLRPYKDGYVIMNRGNMATPEHPCADIIHFSIQDGVELQQTIEFEPCSTLGFFGEALTISDDVLVGVWSDRGQIDFYSAQGEPLQQWNMRLGAVFGFANWRSTLP